MGIKHRQMGRDVGHPSQTNDSLFGDFNLWKSWILPQWAPQIIEAGRGVQHSRQAWPGNSIKQDRDSAVVNKMQSLYNLLALPEYQAQFYSPDLQLVLG